MSLLIPILSSQNKQYDKIVYCSLIVKRILRSKHILYFTAVREFGR